LLSHESPKDAVLEGSGSEGLGAMLDLARPQFAFFGHYGRRFGRVEVDAGPTQVYQLAGLEMRHQGSTAEAGSVGVLTWDDGTGPSSTSTTPGSRHSPARTGGIGEIVD